MEKGCNSLTLSDYSSKQNNGKRGRLSLHPSQLLQGDMGILILSSNFCIDVSTQPQCWRLLFLLLFLTHSLPMLSLGCKALYIVINFLVFWFIGLSSSVVDLKNGTKYILWKTDLVIISLMKFLPQNLVWRNFLVLLKYSFLSFSFISAYLFTSNIPK